MLTLISKNYELCVLGRINKKLLKEINVFKNGKCFS